MLRTLCFLLVIGPASGQIVRPIITDMAHACSTTGKYLSRACSVFNIIGRRAGFTSTSVLNDVKEFANSTAAIPVITSNNLVESAAITLNGTAAVAAGFTANEILWMETTAVGSEAVAVGNIRLRVVTGSIEIEQISIGGNKSLSARFRVPTGYTGYLINWDGAAVNNDQDLRLRAEVASLNRALTAGIYHFQSGAYIPSNNAHFTILPYLKVPALCRIKVSTFSAGVAGTVRAETSFTIVIIADS